MTFVLIKLHRATRGSKQQFDHDSVTLSIQYNVDIYIYVLLLNIAIFGLIRLLFCSKSRYVDTHLATGLFFKLS